MKCHECDNDVNPVEFNQSAYEALCPECGEWFCYADDSERSSSGRPADGTEQCKREYDGKTDWRY